MSRDIRDLIDDVEEEIRTNQDLKQTVNDLEKENKTLKSLIEEQNNKLKRKEEQQLLELPKDILILKDIIISQWESLAHKEEQIGLLRQENDELFDAKELIIQLMDENKMYQQNYENAIEVIERLNNEKGLHLSEIDALKAQIRDQKLTGSESPDLRELKDSYQLIDGLRSEISELERRIKSIQTDLEALKIADFQEIELKDKKVGELKSLNAELQDQIRNLRIELETSKSLESRELYSANQKIYELNAERAFLQSQIDNLQNELKATLSLKLKNKEIKENIENLMVENTELKKQIKNLKTDLEIANKPKKQPIELGSLKKHELKQYSTPLKKVYQRLYQNFEKMKTKIHKESNSYGDLKPDLRFELNDGNVELKEVSIKSEIDTKLNKIFSQEKSRVLTKQVEETNSGVKSEGRRKCPYCHNEKKALIREVIDKENIIMLNPRIYGKKYRCGECGGEFK